MCVRRLMAPLAIVFVSLTPAALFAAIEIDVLASMTGACSMVKIADSDFSCSGVTFSHTPEGRSGFTILVHDPNDETHIVTFSGDNGRIEQDDRYELTIDQMLLKSKDSPKVDGSLTPLIENSTGKCTQIGSLATRKVSSISCLATDEKGSTYEFRFVSDGSLANVMRIKVADLAVKEAQAKVAAVHIVQLQCLQKAVDQGVLPRYRTAFILKCLDE